VQNTGSFSATLLLSLYASGAACAQTIGSITGIVVNDSGRPQRADTRLIQDYIGHLNIQRTVRYTASNPRDSSASSSRKLVLTGGFDRVASRRAAS
jgi:hypothetical protein